jgi:glycosyltransferase involved in cell wall biosynthesis
MLVHLIQGFCDRGYAVDLLLLRASSPALAQLPSSVRRVQLWPRHSLLASLALARWLRRERPAALLVAKDRAGRAAVIARALAGTRGAGQTRLVLRLGTHLSAALAGRNRLQRWLRLLPIRWLYPAIEQIVTVSEGVADDTAQIARLPREQIRVIRNPVITPDLERLATAPCPHAWLADDAKSPVIIGAGRLQRQKDFPTLLRAFSRVRQQRPCRLLILGEGAGRKALESLAQRLGLRLGTDGDLELPGYQANLYAWLARADLFVLSSAWEGSPNVLTEALALGIPVVATDCPSGPREILADGRYGPLVPVGDVEALADAMLKTLADPLPADQLKQAVSDYHQSASVSAYLDALGCSENR